MLKNQNRLTPFWAALLLCVAFVSAVKAQQQAPPAAPPPGAGGGRGGGRGFAMLVHPITSTVFWVSGPSTANNSNDGIIVGKEGVILFDTKDTQEDERALLVELAKITDKPVTHVILSHSDGDHINGLPVLPKSVKIIAQDYCKKSMEDSIAHNGPELANPDYLPTQTYDKKASLNLDGVRVELFHWAPAHTGGDTVLYIPDQKIVFMGDIVITEVAEPFMHMDNGGSPQGVLDSMKGLISLDATYYVSGHGPMVTKAELQRRLGIYEDKMAKIKALVAEGKTLPEIRQSLGEPEPPPGRGPGGGFTSFIYQELTKK